VLYHLLYPLRDSISGLNLFGYITFRSAFAGITALALSLAFGPFMIRRLKRFQVVESIREYVPETHRAKEGTPVMGGLIILFAVILPTVLWADLTNPYVLLILLSTVWMGGVGFIDDYLKAIRGVPKGLVGRYKMIGQVLLGLIIGLVLYGYGPSGRWTTISSLPFLKNWMVDFDVQLFGVSLRWLYIPFVAFVITGTSNAVNLTDGLDGLAAGLVAIAALAFAAITYVTGHVVFSSYLDILYLPGAGELAIFCVALVGACLGFLWYNAHPAEVFMGDTGALALGGILGTLAVLAKKELLLAIIGGLFVAEVLSVMIQVATFKWCGKRVFLRTPFHHHFELKGWPETKVVVRFWIVGILLALLSLSTLKIR